MLNSPSQAVRQYIISLAILILSLGLYILFPTEGMLQSIIVLLSFLCVLPALYIRFVLHRKWSSFIPPLVHFSAGKVAALLGASLLCAICMIIIAFLPYNAGYIVQMRDVFSSFRGFLLYQAVFTVPLLLVITFFCVRLTHLMDFGGRAHSIIAIILLSVVIQISTPLPLLSIAPLAITVLILARFKILNEYIVFLVFFLGLACYDAATSYQIIHSVTP